MSLLTGQFLVNGTVPGNVTVNGTVPGSMYTALMSNNIIQDPYYRRNDAAYKWISRDDWTYSRHFRGIL
ncbi:hypothetical protein KUTeg_015238 [Tegillarca granosa]|uniref:Beta-mannosidase-like galactose-binding domain-containing protein n=1 Tax=Tegillarca granosa TaxID=220873 RepID=A0ABQ9EQ80_TEGGR|nr:hypothetical protein KUTeg_015238 [Tegillarca granosa]